MNIDLLNNINKINVLVFGDYMVDKYIIGDVSRISPEAPVPVIETKKYMEKLGGTGNVINNIVSLGANVKVIGCVGKDNAGDFIISSFNNERINKRFFKQDKNVQTIIKTRVVSKNQQFLRIDEEIKEELSSDYYKYLKEHIDDIFKGINAVVISDYAKGAVNKKFAQLLIKEANKRGIVSIIDPKGKDYSKYENSTYCTPNVKELCDVLNVKIEDEKDIERYGKKLCREVGLNSLILTRSEKGISTIDSNGVKRDYPAVTKEVIDVSGAGDTVVATIAVLCGLGYELSELCEFANIAAGIVVSKFGTATVSLNELLSEVCSTSNYKIQSLKSMNYIVNMLKEKNKKIVFTNGCFDMLHVGHLHSFKEAKKFGDVLIVAVNSDSSVKENKGDLRPIINEDDRMEMICALDCVDYVVLMNDKNPSNIIETLKPDICIKGEDWKDKDLPERKIIENYGGRIEFIKLNPGHSTTKIIEKVLKVYEK